MTAGEILTGGASKAPRRDTKWWGWGDPETLPGLDERAEEALRERIGELTPSPRAASL
jgi:hypothetical protein